METKKNIAIFASGNGTNAENIINYFKESKLITVALIITNNKDAGVIKVAEKSNVHYLIIEKEQFFKGDGYVAEIKLAHIDFIVLAGFLWKVPITLIKAYPNKIINIHPSLLPKFGGKGMYGHFVHEAVLSSNETESGITIHFVDEVYDNGKTIFQITCPVFTDDTQESLAGRIHALEYEYFPRIIEDVVGKL